MSEPATKQDLTDVADMIISAVGGDLDLVRQVVQNIDVRNVVLYNVFRDVCMGSIEIPLTAEQFEEIVVRYAKKASEPLNPVPEPRIVSPHEDNDE